MNDCLFCRIINGKIPSTKIWEDEHFFAFLDIKPINPGHTLLIPKTHINNVFELDETLYIGLFKTAKKLSIPIQKAMNSKRVGIAVEGFLVPHAHIHIVPLHKGGELNLERARHASSEELLEVVEKIKAEIK